ncbi:glycosyltransferase family 4 protein [Schlesneria paludicola]|uniref:glycosyltransferase family 4 protein n=1 Tax=Schlesneria paludicola TaxID=360056 RepID=UPI000299E91F|nr:glycosyltransferase family 4 protein [Schlesneria paludicola]
MASAFDVPSTAIPRRTTKLQLDLFAPDAPSTTALSQDSGPVFGFILVGGTLVGAQVRDIRLANELARRGYQVHVWWAFDRPSVSPLDPRITQRWLFGWSRYAPWGTPAVADTLSRSMYHVSSERFRALIAQTVPGFIGRQVRFVLKAVCRGVEHDRHLIERFARELVQTKVTHLLPNIEILACFARAARNLIPSRPRYLVTFQGYEVYGNYARDAGIEQPFYDRLAEVTRDSDWPAVVVSDAYASRIEREIGLDARQLATIPPGVPVGDVVDRDAAQKMVASHFPSYRPDVPLVTYLGRQDSEKGLDLLMYAVRMLKHRGVNLQFAICGPTAFGGTYSVACRQIAEHLRLNVLSAGFVSNELRSALFRTSRAVVYPSIHEEPFGMVPVEAMAQGTPVLVPDVGGIAGVVAAAGAEGGLRFGCWDSGSLANRLEQLLNDNACHARLSRGALHVAEHFSVSKLGERVLSHLDLPAFSSERSPNSLPFQSQQVEAAA